MKDEQCMHFLQWALPQLRMRWPGFRKVRRQVCKRVDRRLQDLGLANTRDYKTYLQEHPDEWRHLDCMCRITISRFHRNRGVFTVLEKEVLPALAHSARQRGDTELRVWSAGCASGEEPYTVAIMWAVELQSCFPDMSIDIVATDADTKMIQRARDAEYKYSSLKDLPESWRDRAFKRQDDTYCLAAEYRDNIDFLQQDIRQKQPEGRFDLVLCRNLICTYFDEALQLELLERIVDRMHDAAAFVIGAHEHLPKGARYLTTWFEKQRIFRRNTSSDELLGSV